MGSGKSTVAGLLQQHGARVLDADAAARAAIEEDDVKAALIERHGSGILLHDGTVDRAAMARTVFGANGDDERTWLEDLIHPRVRARLRADLDEAAAADAPPWCCVLDVPLLVEGPLAAWCDRIVFIDTPADTRRRRTVENRGWSDDEVARREQAQSALADKRAHSHHVIVNDGTLADLAESVQRLVAELQRSETAAPSADQETPEPDPDAHGRSTGGGS